MPDARTIPAASFPRSAAHWVNAALLVALFAGSAAVFDALPERIPMHFGLDGTPDRWADRSWIAWMALPLITLFVAVVTYGSAWFIGRRPGSMNLPDRKRYDALPIESKVLVVNVVQRFVCWLTAVINGVMAASQYGAWKVASGQSETLPSWSLALVILLIVSSPVTTVYIILRTGNLVGRLSKPSS